MSERASADATLPAPTGRYPVGRRAYYWRDTGPASARSPATDAPRELVAWVWYPAEPAPTSQPAAYLPAGWEAVGQFWGFEAAGVRAHAVEDAPLAAAEARYPVLIFSPSGFPPLLLTAILEEIASHGYVVVGVNHTAESPVTVFPDGRVVPMNTTWMQPLIGPFSGPPEATMRARAAVADAKTADLRFVLNRLVALDASTDPLAGRLDQERLGAFGHSLGGNAALDLCRLDARCRAAANLDGANWNAVGQIGLDRPALLILSEHAEMSLPCADLVRMGMYQSTDWCEAERALTVGGWQTIYERAHPGHAVLIRGSGHISFMDVPFLPIAPGSMVAGGLASVRIEAGRAWRIACDELLAFFDRYLDGVSSPLLAGPSDIYPEAVLGPPRDLMSGRSGT